MRRAQETGGAPPLSTALRNTTGGIWNRLNELYRLKVALIGIVTMSY